MPSLWAAFEEAESFEEYGQYWLALQAPLVRCARQSILVVRDENSGSFVPVARWPKEGFCDPERLAGIVDRSLDQCSGLIAELPEENAGKNGLPPQKTFHHWAIAYPLLVDGQLMAVSAMEIVTSEEEEIRSAMAQLQWGVLSLELYFRRRRVKDDAALLARLRSSVDLLASVLGEKDFNEACMSFVTGIATRLHCHRVSLGFLKNNSIQIHALSHSASFDKRTKLIRYLGMAMDEAILQGSDIVYPPPQGAPPRIIKNHEELARLSNTSSIVTIPLFAHEAYYGALTLEREAEKPFDTDEVNLCRSVFALAAPALEGKRIENLPLALHAYDTAKQHIDKLLGPQHVGHKLTVILIILGILFFGFAKGEFRVTADATLEGSVKRTIAAPFRGYIREARVRHGDTVKEGTLLCTLDEKDLRLERAHLAGQESQFLKQHQEAIALHDRAKANVIKAQLDQVVAQIALADVKLERTSIKAPFDGILLSGDLSQKLGSVVEQGDTLFEIAPLTGYRLILQVDEGEIAYVKEGQKGNLMLSAVPDKFSFTVQRITPMTSAIEGKNCFRVEAGLESAPVKLRPGMEGVGKISVDSRRLISIWTLKLRNWLRLWWWSWWR